MTNRHRGSDVDRDVVTVRPTLVVCGGGSGGAGGCAVTLYHSQRLDFWAKP